MTSIVLTIVLSRFVFLVQSKEDLEQTKREIARNDTTAAALDTAAKCKASGRTEDSYHTKPAKACIERAIRKLSGMKHSHEQ